MKVVGCYETFSFFKPMEHIKGKRVTLTVKECTGMKSNKL
jgi:hypothetical protein